MEPRSQRMVWSLLTLKLIFVFKYFQWTNEEVSTLNFIRWEIQHNLKEYEIYKQSIFEPNLQLIRKTKCWKRTGVFNYDR